MISDKMLAWFLMVGSVSDSFLNPPPVTTGALHRTDNAFIQHLLRTYYVQDITQELRAQYKPRIPAIQ